MTDYKQIIKQAGPLMKPDQTKDLLDQMIEAARRFCVLSPILFRMSTRAKIMVSNNTRYGIDTDHSFKTFTTSAGIKEIIMMSASVRTTSVNPRNMNVFALHDARMSLA